MEETGEEKVVSFRSGVVAIVAEGSEDVVGGQRRLHHAAGGKLDSDAARLPAGEQH